MASRPWSAVLSSLLALAVSIALGVTYLGVVGHLVDGAIEPRRLVVALAVAFSAVLVGWTTLFLRAVRSLDAREGEAERRRRAAAFALPSRASAGLGGAWILAGATITGAHARDGLDRELLEHLVVSLTLSPALIASLASWFVIEDWVRRHVAVSPGGPGPGGGLSLRMRVICVIAALAVVPAAALALSYEHTLTRHEAELAHAGLVVAHPVGAQHLGLLVLCAAFGAVGAAIALLAVRSLTAPLDLLVEGMNRVRSGDLSVRLPVVSRDELGRATQTFNAMLDATEEHRRLEETFGRYLSSEVADAIRGNRISLTGEVKRVTLLFADIRNFTSIAETMAPAALLEFVNTYMDAMIDAVTPHRGRVDKVMGDGLMLVFGAPVPDPQHAANAVRAALAMREALTKLNASRARSSLPQVRIGIGVHTGEVIAGNVGCQRHKLEYAVLGDAVNLASRLEGLTKEAGTDLLVSEDTVREAGTELGFTPVGELAVRGRLGAVRTFTVPGATA